mgnify:CR=1 FL=1
MTFNLTDPANHPANGPLTVGRIERVIEALQRSIQYQNGGDMAYVIADAIKGLEELLVSKEAASEPVTGDELDQMIWKLERDGGMMPKLLSLMRELREVRRAKPYGYVNQALYEDIGCCGLTNDHEAYADSSTHIPLYRHAQPAPVSVPDAYIRDERGRMMLNGKPEPRIGYGGGWNACRAAMLQAGNSPVIPDTWIPVSERMPDVGDIVLTAIDGCVNVGEMERSGANYRYFTSVISGRELPATHWQPLPAAPKEVK